MNVKGPFVYDTRELGRRPGSMREHSLDLPAPGGWEFGLVKVPAGASVGLEVRYESVMDGVLVTASAEVPIAAECGRCLDPIETTVSVPIQELFGYERDPEDPDAPVLDGDLLDLEPVVRDAVVLALPLNPLCDPDCEGLCATCGSRLADVEPDHEHDEVDPRWAALALLKDSNTSDSADKRAPRDPEEK
jgi:uncharacterized protein